MADIAKILRAAEYAARAHGSQTRFWTGELYVTHPLRVAVQVAEYYSWPSEMDEDVVIAAILHDTVEDADVTLDDIGWRFGPGVAELVAELTKPETGGTDAEQSAAEVAHYGQISIEAIIVKLCDIGHNYFSMAYYAGPEDWHAWRREVLAILDAWHRRDDVALEFGLRSRIANLAARIIEIRI